MNKSTKSEASVSMDACLEHTDITHRRRGKTQTNSMRAVCHSKVSVHDEERRKSASSQRNLIVLRLIRKTLPKNSRGKNELKGAYRVNTSG